MTTTEIHQAAILPAASQPSLRNSWNSKKQHSDVEHAIYAIARQTFFFAREEEAPSEEEQTAQVLRKLVRTFTPITNKNKLSNGCKSFSALSSALLRAQQSGTGGYDLLKLSEQEKLVVIATAGRVVKEMRTKPLAELLLMTDPQPAPKEKVPYVRPA